MSFLKVARIVERSQANGPGVRTVIWFQGCTLKCPGCINPWSHSLKSAFNLYYSEELIDLVPEDVEGITLTGGEPLQQDPEALRQLIQLANNRGLSIVIFTGYSLDEVLLDLSWRHWEALWKADIAIMGRYDQAKKSTDPLLGSANQKVIFFSEKYSEDDLHQLPRTEFILDPDRATLVRTGF